MSQSAAVALLIGFPLTSALAAAGSPTAGSHVITGDVICDNEFAIYTAASELTGMAVNYTGLSKCYPGTLLVNASTTDRYLYIACWSDDGVAQGLLHDLKVDGIPAFSDDPRWQVAYTDSDYDSCGDLGSPAIEATMETVIPAPPGGWVAPSIGCANPAFGGNCYGVWGHWSTIDVGVHWTWFDSGNQVSADAPLYPGFNHREFLIFRFDMGDGLGDKFCTATVNSTGAPADISASGSASSGAGNLTLTAAPIPNQSTIFFHGANQTQVPFGNGFLCTTGIVRGVVAPGVGNSANYTYDNSDPQHSLIAFAGTTRHFQNWFRDPMGGGALFNTSNAISITILF